MTIVSVRRQIGVTMEGSTLSINSRATAIKTILLTAWRGKLSNEEWEIKIRKVLPKGVNGDVYDLADCLLKQALVGTVPNQLFISYLQHAINFELVSHGAVLTSIAHQPTNIKASNSMPNRAPSISCLVKLLHTFRDKISCKGTEIECLNLCHSLSQLVHWLLKCVLHSFEAIDRTNFNATSCTTTTASNTTTATTLATITPTMNPIVNNITNNNSGSMNPTSSQQDSITGIIDLCTEAIDYFINRPFTKSLLFISKIEFSKEFDEILRTIHHIQQKFHICPSLQSIYDRVPNLKVLGSIDRIFNSLDMHPSVVAAQQLRCLQLHRIRSTEITSGSNAEKRFPQTMDAQDSRTNYALFNSLYSLVAFDVVLRPARSHKLLARQIATVTNFNTAPISMTYCELIRVCMIGLIDTNNTPFKVHWAFFTFLKMPKLLIELSKVIRNPNSVEQESTNLVDSFASNHTLIFINDLKLAFERLCEYSPLLDEAECLNNCDFFKCLVKELIKNDPGLIQLKNLDVRMFPSKREVMPNKEGTIGGHMIARSEPVVKSMLDTFATQDPVELFSIVSQLVSGKQFEFTLSAAASTGRLQVFVKKLVEHNELNCFTKIASPKNPQAHALIFDSTFLILTYIAQQYGPEVVGSNQQSTFHKWYYDCYNPSTRFNCPKEVIKDHDVEVVSNLLEQIVKPDGAVQMISTNWRDVVFNMPKVMHEILTAWTEGYLSDDEIKIIIEKIKSPMCFMAVVTATWLECYIKTTNESNKQKPIALLHILTKPSQQSKLQEQSSNEPGSKSESYAERSSLMRSIIRKIYFDVVPKLSSKSDTSVNANGNSTSNLNSSNDVCESPHESSFQSVNDRFMSTLSAEEIFISNVKQCLTRGWIDHKSLNSLNSLFKMIGGECFTNLIVEQILTSHESPSDLSRAVNITFGLFHLDIESCAFALLNDTIPSWLMGEKKQALLNQPRAFALAHLTVMTIVEVYNNLRASLLKIGSSGEKQRQLPINGIKQEPGIQTESPTNSINGPGAKRMKLTNDCGPDKEDNNQSITEKLNKLNACIVDLMRLFKEIMADPVMNQRTLFPVLFLQQTVICTRENSSLITAHLQPEIVLDIIKLFSSELTFELVLAISNLSTNNSRRYAAKAMCQLAQVKESKQNQFVTQSTLNLANKLCTIEPLATTGQVSQKASDHAPMEIS